ncbi:hypothetical protein [Sulfurisphaera tokodaii]|uniref:Uncharacterized protein n=2 Tax=Sulfurisphaera tokodaii TaxID=111955 RepID=Q974N5_SULTO|nr:hypothetical protein [Sulfurisphaera tokodaii]BAB65622.1 hypothetical protein STK_06240 [Sulfurisphaera tokodaii str. 7]HII74674.1 hypothetical protein [Sulfurisphaera tokodaii]
MQLIESLDLFNKIKDMLASAERVVTVMTKELSDEIAEILLLKASKGIRVNVITRDTNWADWLESKKSSYGMDEIQHYQKEMNYNLKKERELKILQTILPVTIIGVSVITGLLLFFKLFWIPILPGVIISGILIYYFNRLVHKFDNQIAVLKTMISQRETEIEGIRQEILKNLVVKVNKKVGFTVVIVDGKGIVTPLRLCSKENLQELTFFEELNEEKIKEIFKKLDNSSQ